MPPSSTYSVSEEDSLVAGQHSAKATVNAMPIPRELHGNKKTVYVGKVLIPGNNAYSEADIFPYVLTAMFQSPID